MKLAFSMFVVLALAPACSKQKSAAKPSDPSSSRGASDRANRPTAAATGDMKTMLMHLQRVHFAYDSDQLLDDSRKALQAAATLLEAYPDVSLYIDGHADLRGTSEYNIGLGDRRARIVQDYLVRLGIGRDRLEPVSFGAERPMRDGSSVDDNATNRRAEFRVMRGKLELVLDDGTRFDDRGAPIATR